MVPQNNHLSCNLYTNSPEETRRLGAEIARRCTGGEVFLLDGDLGAGKTCFTQGLARGLEVPEEVTSPTFVLHCQYTGRLELNHIDAYRLEDAPNTAGLGFDELFGAPDNITVIEWPQMIADLLPRGCIHVYIRTTAATIVHDSDSAAEQTGREFIFEASHVPGFGLIERLLAQPPVYAE